jgi:hypothetical protein
MAGLLDFLQQAMPDQSRSQGGGLLGNMSDYERQLMLQMLQQQSGTPVWAAGMAGTPPIGPDERSLLAQNDLSGPSTHFRQNVHTPYGRGVQEMQAQNGALGAAQTQYANGRPIQYFRPGIPNPIWGWGR